VFVKYVHWGVLLPVKTAHYVCLHVMGAPVLCAVSWSKYVRLSFFCAIKAIFHLSKPVLDFIIKRVSVCRCKCCGQFVFGAVALATRVTAFPLPINVSAKTFTLYSHRGGSRNLRREGGSLPFPFFPFFSFPLSLLFLPLRSSAP